MAVFGGGRAAFSFLTIIPVGGSQHSEASWRWAAAWFPFVGAIVGAAGAGLFVLLRPIDVWVAALGALTVTIVLTGALHEDGLADSADALGGSFDREKLFAILKDSRVGTYGALALVLSVGLRTASLVALDSAGPLALILVHTVARTTPVWMMAGVPYVTSHDTSKSRRVVRTGWLQVAFATAFAVTLSSVCVVTGLLSARAAVVATGALVFVALVASRYFISRAGGVTGDFLGATEQLNEIIVLIILAAAP